VTQQSHTRSCIVCGTVLDGPIGSLMRMAGIRRSPQNPNVCNRCSTHIQEGRIVELTIFFADLVGFTAMTNELGSEKAFEIIDAVFKNASEILIRHDAFVDKFIGDAVMAMFNIPVRRNDHVFQAVSAAEDLLKALPRLQEQFDRSLQFRIGIASGHAHVGKIGSKERKDYTAIGEVVNLASRLQTSASPDEIVLNEAAYGAVAKIYPSAKQQSIHVKGFDQPVSVARIGSTPAEARPSERPYAPLRRQISIGSTLLALLGAPCIGAAIIGPMSIALGAGAIFSAALPAMEFLDSPSVQYPLFLFAVIGSIANLFVVWLGYHRRKKSLLLQESLTRYEKIKTWSVASAGILSLLLVGGELLLHHLGHHLFR